MKRLNLEDLPPIMRMKMTNNASKSSSTGQRRAITPLQTKLGATIIFIHSEHNEVLPRGATTDVR